MGDIKSLVGVGEQRAKSFEKRGIKTIEDLLYFFPRDYENRKEVKEISECFAGESVCVKGQVMFPVTETRIRKNMTIYAMIICDDSGAMTVIWYNNKYVKNQFRTGEEYMFFGKISQKGGKRELVNPVYEKPEKRKYTGRIVPIYPLSGNLTQKIVHTAMESAMIAMGELREYLPKFLRERYNIAELNFSMRNIHFPENFEDYRIARRRFVFEELLTLQLALLLKRGRTDKETRDMFKDVACRDIMIEKLPFKLTGAQNKVIEEICRDFQKTVPMNRLVQGDVGSGKTAVAFYLCFVAAKNRGQCVLMAPTEILARQHFNDFSRLFPDVSCCYVNGAM